MTAKTISATTADTIWIDNIKVWATIAVVTVHVAAYAITPEYNLLRQANTTWWVANIFESLFRSCVPLFVMVSGALLLPQTISLGDFLRKRIKRLLFPFILWSLVYMAYHLGLRYRDEGSAAFSQLGRWIFDQSIRGSEYHLWYVYMIIGLFLFIPILQPWIKSAKNKAILYFLSIWLITLVIKQSSVLDTAFDLSYFSGYIGYLILGYYLTHRVTVTPGLRKIALTLFILGFIATFLGTFYSSQSHGQFSDKFYDYLTINVFAMALGAFILIKGSPAMNGNLVMQNLRNIVRQYGFSIYLCHPLVLIVMRYCHINYKLITPVVGVPLTTAMCLIISYMIVYTISKLPYGKTITG